MTRDKARILISSLIEWYTEDLGARLGMSMGKDEYMDALDALWHGPEGELIRRADAIEAVVCHIWHMPNEAYRQFNCENIVREVVEDAINRLPSAEQVTIKLNNPCDSLLTGGLDTCKESGSKLDLISRSEAIEAVTDIQDGSGQRYYLAVSLVDKIRSLPSAEAKGRVISAEKLKRMKFVVIKGDKTEEAYRKGWNGAIDCVIDNVTPSAEAVTHGRLIDADALSEKLCDTTIFIKDGEVFQRMINDAPTVSAEAVQGEWIRKNYHTYICNQCGYEETIYGSVEEYRFCSHCGARMKGAENEIY